MVEETQLGIDDLVMPIFIRPGEHVHRPIASMPGRVQFSIDLAVEECRELEALGIPAVLLFGLPEHKDATEISSMGKERHCSGSGPPNQSRRPPNLVVITDVCICEYTDHGHCGLVRDIRGRKVVDNDRTLELLSKIAVSHADAGADIVAPSDMMDGRIGVVRKTLDEAGFDYVAILSYAAKFASSFYGPFREAAESPPQFGNRKGYQINCPNGDEALREIQFDIDEGADIVMIKPALAYLDIVYRARQQFNIPIACYNVSGEYAMLKAAAQNGWLNEPGTVTEALVGMKRAGANIIITYFAKDIAEWIRAKRPVCTPDGLGPNRQLEPGNDVY